MALSALVTHPDSAVQLIKRYTTIRPCQHHSHPQKELFAFLSFFLLPAEDAHIVEIRVVPRMKIENSECCPGSPPLLRTIGPSSAESLVHTPATYRHYCRHYQIGHLHAPSMVPHALPLAPAFSHIILGQLLGIPSSSADVTARAQFGRGDERGDPRDLHRREQLVKLLLHAFLSSAATSPTAY